MTFRLQKNIAEALGKKLEIYSYEWDSLVPAVQSGNLDMIIAGMSPTEERKQKIDFSDMYYNSNLVIITKGDTFKATLRQSQTLTARKSPLSPVLLTLQLYLSRLRLR